MLTAQEKKIGYNSDMWYNCKPEKIWEGVKASKLDTLAKNL